MRKQTQRLGSMVKSVRGWVHISAWENVSKHSLALSKVRTAEGWTDSSWGLCDTGDRLGIVSRQEASLDLKEITLQMTAHIFFNSLNLSVSP